MDHKLFRTVAPHRSSIARLAACSLITLVTAAACGGGAESPQGATPPASSANGAAQGSTMTASAGGKAPAAASGSAMGAATTTMTTAGAAAGSGSKSPSQGATGTQPATGTTGTMAAAGSTGASSTTGATGATGTTAQSGNMGATGTAGAGAPAAAAGGAAPASSGAGGFPRTGEEINIKAKGPYMVMHYEEGLMASEYSAAVMYYPVDAAPPFAAVALSPGFTAYGTDYEFVGDMLASHGIAALLTTPTTTADLPPQRGEDLVAAVTHLIEENSREGSPLKGKIATDRIGITGHSMGGGGSLFGANSLGDKIRCVVPLQPWQPGGAFPMISAPTMIVGAASDTIAAVAANAQGHYSSIPDSVEKFLIVFQGDHYLSTDRTSGIPQTEMAEANAMYDPQAAYMVPFYKLFLESDERYRPYLYGSERSMELVTDYQKSKM